MDMIRRTALRHVRDAAKEGKPFFIQDIVDIFVVGRNKLRSMAYLDRFPTQEDKQKVCLAYATKIMRLWKCLSFTVGTSTTFESITSAVLYMMRRGVAYDGIYVIPPDAFLHESLPDAHAIKEVGVHRRQFTQVKNTINKRIRECIDSGRLTATDIADCYQE